MEGWRELNKRDRVGLQSREEARESDLRRGRKGLGTEIQVLVHKVGQK